jgi:hypothetical protein
MSSHSQGARTPAREAETTAIFDLPPKRVLPERRPRRKVFPGGWRDAAFASMASFFVLLDAAVLRFLLHMRGLG